MYEASQPIGMFDSGLGGLSVYREVRMHLPAEDVTYYADSAYCPYGTRSPEEIRQRCHMISRLLIGEGSKIIVVACNTASSMAIDFLRVSFPHVSFVGLEPAVKPAAEITRTGKVGVLATPRTVSGDRLRWLIETHASGVEVRTTPGNGLVELVEAGTLRGTKVRETVGPMLDPMLEAGVDVVVLGCTHYPFLRDEIQEFVGPEVAIIDSGAAIARRIINVLQTRNLLGESDQEGSFRLLTSAPAQETGRVASLLLGMPIGAEEMRCHGHEELKEAVALPDPPGLTTSTMARPEASPSGEEPVAASEVR